MVPQRARSILSVNGWLNLEPARTPSRIGDKINGARKRAVQAIAEHHAALSQDPATAIQVVEQTPTIDAVSSEPGIRQYLLWTAGPIVYRPGFFDSGVGHWPDLHHPRSS